jgi:hypothetical protein
VASRLTVAGLLSDAELRDAVDAVRTPAPTVIRSRS